MDCQKANSKSQRVNEHDRSVTRETNTVEAMVHKQAIDSKIPTAPRTADQTKKSNAINSILRF
jgi:hypothetical protein